MDAFSHTDYFVIEVAVVIIFSADSSQEVGIVLCISGAFDK